MGYLFKTRFVIYYIKSLDKIIENSFVFEPRILKNLEIIKNRPDIIITMKKSHIVI